MYLYKVKFEICNREATGGVFGDVTLHQSVVDDLIEMDGA